MRDPKLAHILVNIPGGFNCVGLVCFMVTWRYLWSELDSSSLIFQLFINLDPELFVIVRSMIKL